MAEEHRLERTTPPPSERPGDLKAVAALLWRRWKLMLAVPLLVSSLAFAASYLVPPLFTARTSFLPPQQQGAGASLGVLAGLVGAPRSMADQFVALLHSETVANRLIDRFDLQAAYGRKFRIDTRRDLDRNTRVTIGRRNGVIVIEVDDRDPRLAAALAGGYVEELQRLTAHLVLTEARLRRVLFEAQLNQARERLRQAQLAVQGAAIGEDALKSQPMATAGSLARLNAALTDAKIQLQMLQGQMTESAPQMQSQKAAVAQLRMEVARTGESGDPHGAAPYIGASQELKYQQAQFDLISGQFELAWLDEARDGGQLRLIDPALIPEFKSKPSRSLLAMSAFVIAFVGTSYALVSRRALRHRAQSGQRLG